MNLPIYEAPRWLPGGHLQTLYPALILPRVKLPWQRELWDTPDGDQIAVDQLPGRATSPVFVLFHGLEGSSRSHYAASLFSAARLAGWQGYVPHFRTCGGIDNRLLRAYHAGDSAEIDWVLKTIRARHPDAPLFVAGVSLGGNALLKWLGEQGSAAAETVTAAAGISAPLDLRAGGHALGQGFNRQVYTREFLRTLRAKMQRKLADLPGIDPVALRRARTLREFDDLVTAPLHGFAGAEDYWRRASSKPWLKHITVPTLVINALNDPFIPAESLPCATDVSAAVTLYQPAEGGHVGFVSGTLPGQNSWLSEILHEFWREQS